MHLRCPCHKSEAAWYYLLQKLNYNTTPIQTKIVGEDSLSACALICWMTAERQHCLFNMSQVKGHCIAFVRSAVEVTLSSGSSCCRQLGHATYIESNYPHQLITARLVPSHNTHTKYNECPSVCMLVSAFPCSPAECIEDRNSKQKR